MIKTRCKKDKILVLVPHPDDELLVAGALVYTLRNQYDIRVAYLTNGDSNAKLAEIRMMEAVNSLKILGINEDSIEFLGYGNNWQNDKHIYNVDNDSVVQSIAGRKKTYGYRGHPEYCKKRIGISQDYTRRNIKKDIRMLIEEDYPECIICVDYDSHPDHRALSLFFEETLGEILKENIKYKPIVLKKFAYAGMYYGVNDYYFWPPKITQNGYIEDLLDDRFELDNPTYSWEERLQFEIDRRAKTKYIHNNILYKAAKMHKSQTIAKRVGMFANADMVYWQRRTDGITYRAKVSATSGEPRYVNDFKRIDTDDVLDIVNGANSLTKAIWHPDQNDSKKILYFDFKEAVSVSKIYIYENFIQGEDILEAELRFDNGKTIAINNIEHSGKKTELVFETQENIMHMEFQILRWRGSMYGVTEFEIYEERNLQNIPFKRYVENKNKSKKKKLYKIIDEGVYNISNFDDKDNKYFPMYKLLLKWSYLESYDISQYMEQHGYNRIAIYGLGDLGMKLYHDLEKSNVKVLYGIDNLAGTKKVPFPLYRLETVSEFPETDIVIITVLADSSKIKQQLLRWGILEEKIILIKDLIRIIEKDKMNLL